VAFSLGTMSPFCQINNDPGCPSPITNLLDDE
jgi:hypothetical protein